MQPIVRGADVTVFSPNPYLGRSVRAAFDAAGASVQLPLLFRPPAASSSPSKQRLFRPSSLLVDTLG